MQKKSTSTECAGSVRSGLRKLHAPHHKAFAACRHATDHSLLPSPCPVQPTPRCTAIDPLKIHVRHLNLLNVSVLRLCLRVHVATYMYIYKNQYREIEHYAHTFSSVALK